MVQNGQPLGQMVIKLGLETTAFSDSLTGATRAVKTSVREMGAGFRILDSGGKKLESLSFKQQGLTKVIQAQTNELGYLKEAYDKTLDSEGNATSTTAKAAQKYNEAQAKLAGYQAQLSQTSGELARYKVETEGVTGTINRQSDTLIQVGDRLGKVGSGMQAVGGAATKYVTAPLALGMGLVTKAAVEWESAFAGVKKTNDEVVDSNGNVTYSYKDLENGLRGLAKELPSSHKEIAEVAEAAGQLGIQTPNVIEFTKTMIDMGESTNMSAEQAATTFARFANITQMSQKDFDRLGAVVVELGNNFATTETEISDMGLRLAGAGTQIGMSQAEIMGFATALSSVGVEAEAGGSAFSKVMIQMQLATEKGASAFDGLKASASNAGLSWDTVSNAVRVGGKELKNVAGTMGLTSTELRKMVKEADKSAGALSNFSDVAGMTSDEFAKLFKEDPSKAIMKFVQGLADAESQGKSAIAILDDMDIKEIRLRDSLLRAANASGVFEGAIKMSSNAWKENTALTDEANKRYETTESKLKSLKNEAHDAAIDLGGPFVDALRAGIEASKPIIKNLGEMAKAFSEMDKEQQQNILKWGAFALALGPATKLIGSVVSVTGTATKGLGLMGKGIVELAAKSAEKKAIEGVGTTLAGVGTQAIAASGASGIGGFISVLASVAPVATAIVGVGGVLALGYGAWKLWGEEAWNAGQRTKRWGIDVGEATDEALQKIQTSTLQASGEFGLMAQGFDVDSKSIIQNFETIGRTIENDLTSKLEAYKKAVELLPTELQSKANEVIKNEQEQTQRTLEIIQQNNEEVLNIKKQHIDKDGELTIQGAKMIQDLMKQSTEEYLKITVEDADARKEVMVALSGDIENATEEQAESWIKSLAKQRQATKANYTEEINDYRKKLEETKQLNEQEIDMLVGIYEEARETSTDALDAQMALIVKKYPEIANKIFLANGQLASEMGDMGTAVSAANKEILDNAEDLADKLSANAQKNAKQLEWVADQATAAGKTWNSLELLDKEGNVKSNASEILKEATKDTQTWNKMRMVIHDANLNSNAKKMIGEAAIANGWWKGMAWEDKEAVLQDEFSINVYKALDSSGKWNELSFEQKKAILYSDTPEVMAETFLQLGLWDDYQPTIKELKAKNIEFLNILNNSEEKLKAWQDTPTQTKELLADNYDFITKVYKSEEEFKRWQAIPNDTKEMLAKNDDLLLKLFESKNSLAEYNALSPGLKTLIADGSAKMTYEEAKTALENYENLSPELKLLIVNNEDAIAKIDGAKTYLTTYEMMNPTTKLLNGDSSSVINAAAAGENSLNMFNWNNPLQKNLTGNSANVINSATSGESALNSFNSNNPAGKSLEAYDNASGNANSASNSVERFWNLPEIITKTLNVVGDWLGFEKGTNFHPGGMAMVNDQKGATYKELVTLPNGASFIPEGRDVFLPLPRGSKVLPARQTAMLPQYAGGVGVPSNASDVQYMTRISSNVRARESQQSGGGDLASLMKQMIFEITKLQPIFSDNSAVQANLLRELLDKDPIVKITRDSIARATNEVNARDQIGKYFS